VPSGSPRVAQDPAAQWSRLSQRLPDENVSRVVGTSVHCKGVDRSWPMSPHALVQSLRQDWKHVRIAHPGRRISRPRHPVSCEDLQRYKLDTVGQDDGTAHDLFGCCALSHVRVLNVVLFMFGPARAVFAKPPIRQGPNCRRPRQHDYDCKNYQELPRITKSSLLYAPHLIRQLAKSTNTNGLHDWQHDDITTTRSIRPNHL